MQVRVYGRKGCGSCDRTKQKLNEMGVRYESRDIDRYSQVHEGWRTDGSVELLVHLQFVDMEKLVGGHVALPIIEIDGTFYDKKGAMIEFKHRGFNIRKMRPAKEDLAVVA